MLIQPGPPLQTARFISIATKGTAVFVGGVFTSIGGQNHKNIAVLNATTGKADSSWNPIIWGQVNSLAISGTSVYAGGKFTNVNGKTRNNIAALDVITGNVDTTWNPNANGEVTSVAQAGQPFMRGADLKASVIRAATTSLPWMRLLGGYCPGTRMQTARSLHFP